MSKIDRQTPLSAPLKPKPVAAEAVKAAPAPAAVAGDRLALSGAGTAERLRGLSRQIEATLAFKPRTTAQAKAWQQQGEALFAQASPALRNGDLKALPLKERSELMANVKRLEGFLQDAPGIVRFFAGD